MINNPTLSDDMLNNFSRQIIGLSVNFQILKNGLPEEENWWHFTGFIYSDKTKWYWVTAGHVFNQLRELKNREEHGLLRINYYRLIDKVGMSRKGNFPIPFNFDIEKAKYIFNEGNFEGKIKEDFGFYELYYLVKETLGNSGVKPFTIFKEASATPQTYNEFYLLGIPNEEIITKGNHTTFSPVIVSLKFIQEDHVNPNLPRLLFALPDGMELTNIMGMSGGPVIGFPVENKERYFLIGIQSGYDAKQNISIVFPIKYFITYLQNNSK
jgi:hypothetical protein